MTRASICIALVLLLGGCSDEFGTRYNAAMRQMASGEGDAALQAIQTLADEGYARAERHMGLLYLTGVGVSRDAEAAAVWLARAAEQNDPGGLYYLAELAWHGTGRDENRPEALALMERVAGQQVIAAMWRAGEWAEVLEMQDKAVQWYTQAAGFGHAKAMQRLVQVYTKGELGQAADAAAAQRWQAAQQRKAF